MNAARSGRYLHNLTRIHCGPDLLRLKVFPNAKEVTESFAAFQAVLDHLTPLGWKPGDRDITLIAVGDGATPRTAATFAFRTHWECFAVDPVMGLSWVERRENRRADRLTCIRERIEDCAFDADRAIVVAVHSHARLDATLAVVNSSEIAVVAMPCCFPRTLPKPPDLTYRDPAVWTDCEDCDAADAVSFYLGFEIAGLWKWHPNTEAGQ